MYNKYSFDFIDFEDSEVKEIINSIKALNDDDSYKDAIYHNFKNMYEFSRKNREANKTAIKLYNDMKPGQTTLKLLSNASENIQNIYSNVYKRKKGITANRGKVVELANLESEMLVTLKAGSLIFEIDNIGNIDTHGQLELLSKNLSSDEKFEILDEIIEDISNLSDEVSLENFIENYGIRILNYIQTLFRIYITTNTEMEYSNKYSENIYIDKGQITSVYEQISGLEPKLKESKLTLKGLLVRVDHQNNSFHLDDSDNIYKIKVMDDSLRNFSLITNEIYSITVDCILNIDTQKVIYELPTIIGTSLDNTTNN